MARLSEQGKKRGKAGLSGPFSFNEFVPSSAWVYDSLNILVEAIKTPGEDRAKICEAILALKGYQGALGTFSSTPNGDGLHEVSLF